MNEKEIISKELDICLEGLGKCSYTLFKDDDSYLCCIGEINGVTCDVDVMLKHSDGDVFICEEFENDILYHFIIDDYYNNSELKGTDMFYKILLKEMLCSKE